MGDRLGRPQETSPGVGATACRSDADDAEERDGDLARVRNCPGQLERFHEERCRPSDIPLAVIHPPESGECMVQGPAVVVGAVEWNRLGKERRCAVEVALSEGDE